METFKVQLLLCFLGFALINHTLADLATEAAANSVEMKFYRVQVADWQAGGHLQTLSAQLSSRATTYCTADPAICGLTTCCAGTAFKDANIQKVTGYPQDDLNDMLMKIYIDFPNGVTKDTNATLQFVLSSAVVKTIIDLERDNIKAETSYYITWVDDTIYYGIPPPALENSIIIPIACVVLLVMIIITIVCVVVSKKKQRAEHREKMLEKKKSKTKTSKVGPEYDVDGREPKVPSGPDARNKEKMYEDKELKSRSSGAEGTDKAEIVNEVGARHTSLPPLDDDEKKEKRRKKRSKKHSKHRKEGSENAAYDRDMASDEGDTPPMTTEL